MSEGGCLCGRVRFRVSGEPLAVNCCHCHDCQRLSGSAFAINATFPPERVEIVAGAPTMKEGVARCGECEILLWATNKHTGELRYVRVGTLDDAVAFVPDTHYFVARKHPWVVIPPGVKQYDELPSGEA